MKFINFLKVFLILILPFLIFLLVFNFASLSDSFFTKKFSEYGVNNKFPDAGAMHQKVINFIEGKSDELPSDFNDREKQHLLDVKKVISALTITLYIMVGLFLLLLVISAFTLKFNSYIINFVGRVMVWGGVLTVALAALLFLFITFDFGSTFESMHQMFFQKGTYMFDPAKEAMVNLYPEQLFMDLGIRISAWIIISAILIILIGLYLVLRTKNQKQ
ncbi:MAG TPA: DUF1461 domain-containing protein [Candidatus Nanoarchaeia archaeon]|nr:DUF1461 domain-containing protein [Candidatus Nanoarchaeia archaeon]